ncbi:MAG: hypothetical protein M3Q31_24580 [Actinomycetota bacterium]|nr:hypothetical protein [Actinomycetota bacterium]
MRTAMPRAGIEGEVARIWFALALGAFFQYEHEILDRYLEAGIAYCEERDFEMFRRYLHTTRAQVALQRAGWSEATDAATLVLHDPGPSIIPRLYAWIVLGLVRARRGDPQPSELIDRAAALAEQQGQPHALAAVAEARAELAWLEGRPDDIAGVTEFALAHALRHNAWREAGELCRWRAGVRELMPGAGLTANDT